MPMSGETFLSATGGLDPAQSQFLACHLLSFRSR
jgi:hypothetical protein